MPRKKVAVVGASHFQLPLIEKAQEMGCEVHAFAWKCGDVGESAADVFHPVSIVETQAIVDECRRIGIDAVCTIASDLATVAVSHVADELGLVGNSLECMSRSTNKQKMRQAFARGGDPSPRFVTISISDKVNDRRFDGALSGGGEVVFTPNEVKGFNPMDWGLAYPIIVKPVDRSGSRGVMKLEGPDRPIPVADAIMQALDQGFTKRVLVEEYVDGEEFSVEGVSWNGDHRVLAVTRKATTGAPRFIETAHVQPAGLPVGMFRRVESVVIHALDTLGVKHGASHSEVKITPDGDIRIIEIGARMGGDCIGTHLVPLSTGIDYVGAVVDIALGNVPNLTPKSDPAAAAVRFMFDAGDLARFDALRADRPDLVRYSYNTAPVDSARPVLDSSTRLGHYVLSAPSLTELLAFLPNEMASVLASVSSSPKGL